VTSSAEAVPFEEMPEPYGLARTVSGKVTVITRGPYVVGRYESDDLGLRNLVVVSLTDAGHEGKEVAAVFGLTPQYVSMLRGRAKASGSAGLVRPRGGPRKLSPKKLHQAACWSAEGLKDAEIARRLGVHRSTIGRLLENGHLLEAATLLPAELPFAEVREDEPIPDEPVEEAPVTEAAVTEEPLEEPSPPRRPVTGEVPSRYAGAMLLHPFLSRLGAGEVLGALSSKAAQRYDATSAVLAAVFGFSLGISSLEGAKHLVPPDAGALIGCSFFPELRTLRPRLGEIAEATDPLALQRAFAKAMLASDEVPAKVFFCDDHFVAYTGSSPLAKGHNARRGRTEPGREDTFVTDQSWRAICFSTAEPTGLSTHLRGIVDQLKEVTCGGKILLGFDRGGSYPKVFAALREESVDFVTYRRAPLAAPSVVPRWSWTTVEGRRLTVLLADESVELAGYGECRQLSLYEHGKLVLQVLTSDTTATGAALLCTLRRRWCIENAFKYAEDHHGIHWLTSYEMESAPDTSLGANPQRRAARAKLDAAKAALGAAEQALGQKVTHNVLDVKSHLEELRVLRDEIAICRDELEEAKAALTGVKAKLPRNVLDPNAVRATPALARRALQMVCRLLAYNAELDLARRLNAYLCDDDEYRTVARNLLHLGGRISFASAVITVTLDQPHPPRLARALRCLLEELNAEPAHVPGDKRPITYCLAD
jgi:transposase